jgi:hypothetical protein
MTGTTSWRDDIKVHPAADLFPMMSDADLDALAKDIAENGLLHPIVWFRDQLIDGRNRVAAVARITDKKRRDEITAEWRDGKKCIVQMMLPDPLGFVISANLHRRHLTAEQKREMIAKLIKTQPEKSDRQVAEQVKASPSTIGAVRKKLEQTGDVSSLDTRTDTRGRQQPAHKLGSHARTITHEKLAEIRAETPTESDAPPAVEAIGDRKDALRVLEDTTRFLAQRRADVLAIPIATRIARVRSVMDALGVGLDHLIPPGRR